VITIAITDAFTTICSNMPRLNPTCAIASVEAACPNDSDAITPVSATEKPNRHEVIRAAAVFPTTTKAVKINPRASVSGSNNNAGSMLSPIDTRKIGTKTAAPTNSSRSISGPLDGTSRLMPSPARNAPIRPSTPPSSATVAPVDMPTSAKTNRCIRERPTDTKNTRVSSGSSHRQKPTSSGSASQIGSVGSGVVGWIWSRTSSFTSRANVSSNGSCSMTAVDVARASTVSDRRSATTPADTAALTARFFWRPAAWTSGYATSVFDAHIAPISEPARAPTSNTVTTTTRLNVNGMKKPRSP